MYMLTETHINTTRKGKTNREEGEPETPTIDKERERERDKGTQREKERTRELLKKAAPHCFYQPRS